MFDDFFGQDDFLIDPDDVDDIPQGENWNTGIHPDIFTSGNNQDIFSTKSAIDNS